jgi:hypothetical protein
MQQLLEELLAGLSAFDCDRTLNVLSEAVAEYRRVSEIRDHVWARKVAAAKSEDRKVSDLASKRRLSEAGPR